MVRKGHVRKHPESPPYPHISVETRLAMDEFLGYWEGVAYETVKRLQRARGKSRDPHVLAHIKYWKHALAAYRWARKRNSWSIDPSAASNKHSTKAFDPAI